MGHWSAPVDSRTVFGHSDASRADGKIDGLHVALTSAQPGVAISTIIDLQQRICQHRPMILVRKQALVTAKDAASPPEYSTGRDALFLTVSGTPHTIAG